MRPQAQLGEKSRPESCVLLARRSGTGAAPFDPAPAEMMAVSRILFSSTSGFRIGGHLSCSGSLDAWAALRLRLLPGGWTRIARPGRRPVPPVLSCTAQGLSCPFAFAQGGGLLPRLFTLTSLITARSERSSEPEMMKRSIFCDTCRRKELSFSAPLLSQGVLPCGVRTFLSGVLVGAGATARQQNKDACTV